MNRWFYILMIFLFPCSVTFSQVGIQSFQQYRTLSAKVGYQYWNAGDDQVEQMSIPVTFAYSVNDQLKLDVITSPAFSTLITQTETKLGGMSDTRIRGSYLFNNEVMLLTFGVNLPLGKSSLDQEEYTVANILATHALNFQSPLLGQGLDVSTGFVMVQNWNDLVLGFGAGFLYRGSYEPFSDYDFNYNPGDEFSISGGVDYFVSRDDKLMIDVSYTIYGKDQANDIQVFKSGNRLTLQALWVMEREFLSWVFLARNRIQGKNQAGSGELIPERQNSNGNEFELSATGLYKLNPATRVTGVIESRIYSNNAYDIGGATIFGLGGGGDRRLTDRFYIDVDLRYYFGSINAATESVGLSGFQALGGFKFYM